MSPLPPLTADCGQCAGLCCMALAFDAGDMFAFDKPAGEPCRHLDTAFRCTIHAGLEQAGFRGCVRFDCLGAGQRVVGEVFAGADWRGDPVVKRRMLEAFRAMREVHRLLELLQLAARLPLDPAQQAARGGLIRSLCPEGGWTEPALAGFETGPLPLAVADFLGGLRDAAAASRPA